MRLGGSVTMPGGRLPAAEARSAAVSRSARTPHVTIRLPRLIDSNWVNLKDRLERLLGEEFAHEGELARVAESDTAPAAGAWRATDHLGHFTLWRRLFLDHTRAALARSNPATPPDDLDAVNDRQLAMDRRLPAGELVTRWRQQCKETLDFLHRCGGADLDHPPAWYAAATVGAALIRNSYTHPCGHLVDFYFERGQLETAAGLAEEMADVAHELSDLDFRFPAGTYAFRGFAYALRGRPDEAMGAFGQAVALRPALGPMLREEASLASLRGRPDFEAMTAPHDATT